MLIRPTWKRSCDPDFLSEPDLLRINAIKEFDVNWKNLRVLVTGLVGRGTKVRVVDDLCL
jgi:hypothetical protein